MDALIEGFAWRGQADFYRLIACERRATAAMDFGGGLPGPDTHFDGSDYFLGVGDGDPGSGFGVETRQDAMKMGGAVNFCTGSQAVADFFGTFWSVGEPFQQGAQVKTGAGGDDRKFFSEAQIVQDAEGAAAIFPGGENFFGIEQVDQMVGDALLLGWQNFSGADIEVTVDLSGITNQDFAVQFFGDLDAQRGFAGGGGTENYDQRREATHPENFQ